MIRALWNLGKMHVTDGSAQLPVVWGFEPRALQRVNDQPRRCPEATDPNR